MNQTKYVLTTAEGRPHIKVRGFKCIKHNTNISYMRLNSITRQKDFQNPKPWHLVSTCMIARGNLPRFVVILRDPNLVTDIRYSRSVTSIRPIVTDYLIPRTNKGLRSRKFTVTRGL